MKKWRLSTLTGTDQDIEDRLCSRKEIQYNNSCTGNKKLICFSFVGMRFFEY